MTVGIARGRTTLLDLLDRQLGMLVSSVEIAVRNNHGTAVVAAETILAGLLNRIHGWLLVNANTKWQNCPGIDLIDEKQGIAVQVTATRTVEKVRHTREEAGKFNGSFKRLIILIITNASPTRAMEECADSAELWNIPQVFRSAGELEAKQLEDITAYLARELGTVVEQVSDLPHLELHPATSLQASGFVGREEELEEIGRRFAGGDRMVVLSGIGGMGKTELAVHYARSYPGLVHFVRFETNFTCTLANMAQGIRPRLRDEELGREARILAGQVLSVLETSDENDLLILDGANCETGVLADLLRDPVFERICSMPLRILLTTRSDWDDAIRVGPMPEEPLFAIFHRHGANATGQEMRELIRAVGGHTLTIALIARTLNGKDWRTVTARLLLEDLRKHTLQEKRHQDVAAQDKRFPGQNQIYKHLSVLFDVSGISDVGRDVMRYAAMLPEGGMDSTLFGTSLRKAEQTALDRLLERGWLEARNGLLTIYPIIRMVCLSELQSTDENCRDFLVELFRHYDQADYQPVQYRQMAQLLTTASAILEDTEGTWALNAGVLWRDLGAFEKALDCDLYAMKQKEASLPPEHPDLATSYNNVGISCGNLGDHHKALEYMLKALELREKVLPPEHLDLAISYNNVGTACGDLGDHHKALEYQLKAQKIKEKVLPPEHPSLATSYDNVGNTYGSLGDHHKALEYQLKAMKLREKVLLPEHPDMAVSYNNVGITYGYLDDHRKALEYGLKALEIVKKNLPPEHPDLATSYDNVGIAYGDLGDDRKALECGLKALEIRENILLPEHPDIANSCSNIAVTYRKLGDLTAAARYMRRAADLISHSDMPEDHPCRTKISQWADRYEWEAKAPKPRIQSWLVRLFSFGKT